MGGFQDIFKYKSVDKRKLQAQGFVLEGENYQKTFKILDGEFTLFVFVTNQGDVSTKVVDNKSGEDYVLHMVEGSQGTFVGQVKSQVEDVLKNVCKTCFEDDVFKSKQTKQVLAFCQSQYGDSLEFLWASLPDAAILRRKDTKKWYAVFMIMDKSKLNPDESGRVDVIDLHALPQTIDQIADGKTIFRGYHMNKKNWLSISLDGSVQTDRVLQLVQQSYQLAK